MRGVAVPFLLGLVEAALPGRGRLAVVVGLLGLLDPAPPVGQLDPPRRHRHRRATDRVGLGFRRGGGARVGEGGIRSGGRGNGKRRPREVMGGGEGVSGGGVRVADFRGFSALQFLGGNPREPAGVLARAGSGRRRRIGYGRMPV